MLAKTERVNEINSSCNVNPPFCACLGVATVIITSYRQKCHNKSVFSVYLESHKKKVS